MLEEKERDGKLLPKTNTYRKFTTKLQSFEHKMNTMKQRIM